MSVVALSGGIGGAKLALGLYRTLPPKTLTVITNTGDDFEHLVHRHARRITLLDQPVGVGAIDIIHRNPQLAVEFTAIMNADDIRMPQG